MGVGRRLIVGNQVFYASLLRLLDDKALTVIFANVEDILLANTAFLSSLEQRQKACRLYVDMVGDLLEEHMPAMEIYTVSLFDWVQRAGWYIIRIRTYQDIEVTLIWV